MAGGARICVGQIGAAHGVCGEVRLHSFTSDPCAIAGYGPLETEDGRVFEIESLQPAKDHLVARLSGIHDRDAARALANAKLYVLRERLPDPGGPDEFYHADLIGLTVHDPAGMQLGIVVAIHNFGAGDLIEVRPATGAPTQMLPFNQTTVPVIDLAVKRMVVAATEALFAPPPLVAKGGSEKASQLSGRTRKHAAKKPFAPTVVGSRGRRPPHSR